MDYTTLGRTGLRVSVAGLGCGGFSRLGLGTGGDEAGAIGIIRLAIDLGVNLFDTAAAYGTEAVLGQAIKSVRREDIVICTKAPFSWSSGRADPQGIVASLDQSPRQLDLDCIDVYQLHGIAAGALRPRASGTRAGAAQGGLQGQVPLPRHHGDRAQRPRPHDMLHQAAQDAVWDVCMVGFSMMHQNARTRVFPQTRSQGVGTLLMFAVRQIFSQPGRLAETLKDLAADGQIAADLADDPLGLPGPSRRRQQRRRCRLSLRPPRARRRCRAVRHRQPRPPQDQYRLALETASARADHRRIGECSSATSSVSASTPRTSPGPGRCGSGN